MSEATGAVPGPIHKTRLGETHRQSDTSYLTPLTCSCGWSFGVRSWSIDASRAKADDLARRHRQGEVVSEASVRKWTGGTYVAAGIILGVIAGVIAAIWINQQNSNFDGCTFSGAIDTCIPPSHSGPYALMWIGGSLSSILILIGIISLGVSSGMTKSDKAATIVVNKPAAAPRPDTNVAEQLQKLVDLHAAGALSDEEFSAAKARLLG